MNDEIPTEIVDASEPTQEMFGLTYASYLVLPRVILQSMPLDWQKDFAALIEKLETAAQGLNLPDYHVNAVNENGNFIRDDLRDYERGRRRVELKEI